ncbi:hypothetical protein B0G76_8434 [Paraburkholderia sp. BL23I1N1]|nr:hypothetical protein B0G76_8434 [Paraburkholderia sp. BL23I1N1]
MREERGVGVFFPHRVRDEFDIRPPAAELRQFGGKSQSFCDRQMDRLEFIPSQAAATFVQTPHHAVQHRLGIVRDDGCG